MLNGVVFAMSVGLLLAVGLRRITIFKKHTRQLPYPPGPSPLPFVGNLFDIDNKQPWITYTNWAEEYGEIVHAQVLGQHYVIINSARAARGLLEQNSANYSDRPVLEAYDLFAMNVNTAMLPYGPTWRLHRKLFHQTLRAEMVSNYSALCSNKVCELVAHMTKDNADTQLSDHLKNFTASVILAVTYGYKALPVDDPFVARLQRLSMTLTNVLSPERAALLAAFPFAGRIPMWLPGGGFKRSALICREMILGARDVLFGSAERELSSGSREHFVVSDFLSGQSPDHVSRDEQALDEAMRDAAVTVYISGADSMSATLSIFILAMILYPDVQKRAQEEIDQIVGRDKLPTSSHRKDLPYLEAVMRETLRWHTAVPLGLPHITTENDTFEGYRIPKGALVIANAWAMNKNVADSSTFDPMRHFLSNGEIDPENTFISSPTFGFGRRVCPGRFFADEAIWIAMATMLAMLRFEKTRDYAGREIEVNPKFTSGVTIHPEPFHCKIVKRCPERFSGFDISA